MQRTIAKCNECETILPSPPDVGEYYRCKGCSKVLTGTANGGVAGADDPLSRPSAPDRDQLLSGKLEVASNQYSRKPERRPVHFRGKSGRKYERIHVAQRGRLVEHYIACD